MKRTLKHVFAGLFFVFLFTAYFFSIIFTKDMLYLVSGLSFLYLYLNQLIEIDRLERRLKKYKKAVSGLVKMYEKTDNEIPLWEDISQGTKKE